MTWAAPLPDEVVDALLPEAAPASTSLTVLPDDARAPDPLLALCRIADITDALVLGEAAAAGHDGSTERQGFTFLDGDLVLVVDRLERTAMVRRPSFERLMARVLGAVLESDGGYRGAAVADWRKQIQDLRDALAAAGTHAGPSS